MLTKALNYVESGFKSIKMQVSHCFTNDEDVINDLIGYLVLLKISMTSDQNNEVLETARSIYGNGISGGNIELQAPDILDHARDFD